MRLKQIIERIGQFHTNADLIDFEVRGISSNSKQVKKNFIFVAIKGAQGDGHQFIAEALRNGAGAVIIHDQACGSTFPQQGNQKVNVIAVEDTRQALASLAAEFFGHPSRKVKVVGITGTNGKTTVTYLLEAILKSAGKVAAVIGTVNYRFQGKVLVSKNTTPVPVELQSLLSEMLNAGVDYAAVEVSSHALDQKRAAGVDFHSAIFTNLSQDHLDYHKDLESYFQIKSRLFRNVNKDAFVVLNQDSEYGRRLKELTNARIITYGINSPADVAAEKINFDINHTEFLLSAFKNKIKLKAKLIGIYNVYNILAVCAWALKEGMDLSAIKPALESFSFVPGRLERVEFPGDFYVFVDYAHTEDALDNVLRTLRPLTKSKIIVVFGCGGERDKTKRPKMGYCVTELADYAIITNDNPRSENPQEIIKDITVGIKKKNYAVVPGRMGAISEALRMASAGDIVLIAGKGHEDYQVLSDKTVHFSDVEAARECLRTLNY